MPLRFYFYQANGSFTLTPTVLKESINCTFVDCVQNSPESRLGIIQDPKWIRVKCPVPMSTILPPNRS